MWYADRSDIFIISLWSAEYIMNRSITKFDWISVRWLYQWHYCDVIMGAMVSQITSLSIVYSTVHSFADQRKHQSSASLAFVRWINRWPVNHPDKWPVTRKMFAFDDVIMGRTPGMMWKDWVWVSLFSIGIRMLLHSCDRVDWADNPFINTHHIYIYICVYIYIYKCITICTLHNIAETQKAFKIKIIILSYFYGSQSFCHIVGII